MKVSRPPGHEDIWREVRRARAAAHVKHGANSIEVQPAGSTHWLPILVEEVGEVANALTYDTVRPGALRSELVDVLAVASAWVDALDDSRIALSASTTPRRNP